MAEGRMLKKAISTSRRLADLKTDSARMLYTWIIPHLDIEGRFFADPSMIKGSVVPRLKAFTEELIQECLNDMASVGLITIYQIDGDAYFHLRKFEDHQTLRANKEAKSIIPPPPLMDKSLPTPGLLQDKDGTTPAQDKIREEKLREANAREDSEKHLPVDNSKGCSENPPIETPAPDRKEGSLKKPEEQKPPSRNTHGERWTQQQGNELNTLGDEIKDRYGARYHQKVQVWLQTNYNRKNPGAMIRCLQRLIQERQKGESIPLPERWLDAVLNGNEKQPGENGKAEAEDSDRECQEHKKEFTSLKDLMPPAMVGAAP